MLQRIYFIKMPREGENVPRGVLGRADWPRVYNLVTKADVFIIVMCLYVEILFLFLLFTIVLSTTLWSTSMMPPDSATGFFGTKTVSADSLPNAFPELYKQYILFFYFVLQ